MQRRELPDGWDGDLEADFPADPGAWRSAQASGKVLERASPIGCRGSSAAPPTWLRPTKTADVGARPASASRAERPQLPPRHPRARLGGHRQRHVALSKLRPLWSTYLIFSDYARAADPPLGADGAAGDPPLHPRLDGRRRGRPDPPAGRAARLAAGDARAPGVPPGRRQRGRRDLADGPATSTSRWRWCSPARRCRSSTAPPWAPPPVWPAAPTCSPSRRRRARGDPDRHRQRGRARPRRPRGAGGRRDRRPRRQPALLGALRPPDRSPTATRCCRRRSAPASRSRRPRPSAGTARSAMPAVWSECTPSARRRR